MASAALVTHELAPVRPAGLSRDAATASPSASVSGSPSPSPSPGLSASPGTASAVPATTRHSPSRSPSPAFTAAVSVISIGSLSIQHHTLRVVSARADLTGQRELAWVADSGYRVGTARCTQNFRLPPGTPARVRPTMLICWRTSAARSVYTVAVDIDRPPSAPASVAAIDRVWSTL